MRGTIAVALAPLRREPAHESECVTQGLHGESFEILQESADGAWREVRLASDGYTGWLRSWYGTGADQAGASGALGWVRGRVAEVREKPTRGARLLALLPWPARLALEEEEGVWVRARLASGSVGYVTRAQVTREAVPGGPATRARIVKTAASLLGAPDLWGGRSAWGFDCSGLVQAVFAWHGVKLPRDSQQQWNLFNGNGLRRETDGSRSQAGDLLFFGSDESRITHVALATGNGDFLHAYGQVCPGSLNRESQHIVPELVTAVVGTLSWPPRDIIA